MPAPRRSFAGSGNAAQSNSLTGFLTVTVTRVFDNGNMEIAGQKKLRLNNGDEYVRLTGLVRPEDVSATNVVLSNRVADAEIVYVGAGEIVDSSRQGVAEPHIAQHFAVLIWRFSQMGTGMMNRLADGACCHCLALLLTSLPVQADELKDLTSIAGVRSNQLVGYGVVVGLAGTGDGSSGLTLQSLQSMVSQFGLVTDAANSTRRMSPP